MTIYIKANSKKAINEALSNNETITGTNHSIFGGGGDYSLTECPTGTTIKVYDKLVGGSPYAKAYGTWNGTKVI